MGPTRWKLSVQRMIDLIISDLVMPKMGGLELLEALRDREIDTPIILMTFHGSEGTAVRALGWAPAIISSSPLPLTK